MNNDRIWMLGSLVLSTVVLVAGWFLGISPVLQQAATADAERLSVENQNVVQRTTLATLTDRFASIDTLKSQLDDRRASLPDGADYAGFLAELNAVQTAAGVSITNFAVSDALPFIPVEPIQSAEAPAEGETEKAAPVEPASSTTAVSLPEVANAELVTGDKLVAIPIVVAASGDYAKIMDFVAGVQSGPRLFLVYGLTVSKDSSTGIFTADISGYAYSLSNGSGGAEILAVPGQAATAGDVN